MSMIMSDNSTRLCISLSPKINSRGIWNEAKDPMLNYSLPLLELQMFFVFTITGISQFVLKHFGIPNLVSQMVGGLIFSPLLLGQKLGRLLSIVFPPESKDMIETAGFSGYAIFLFLTGVKTDIGIVRNTGRKAVFIGILSVLSTLFIGMVIQHSLVQHMHLSPEEDYKLTFLTVSHATTSFIIIANLLEELGILNSELGRLCLSSAIIGDLLNLIMKTIMVASKLAKEESVQVAVTHIALTIGFSAALFFGIRPGFFCVIRQTPEGKPVKRMHIYTILMMVIGSSVITHLLGQFVFLGPFLCGLMLPDGPPLGSAFVDMLDSFVSGVFLPFLVTTSALRADFSIINGKLITVSAIVAAATFVIKMLACLIPTLYCKMPLNDAFSISLIMSSRGIIDLMVYTTLRDMKLITDDVFTTMLISLVIIASAVQILVSYLYDPSRKYAGYQKRNIMHTKSADLKILACVYRAHNIPAIINVLNASHPTKEDPINVHVLHLIELTGRSSPIFISHQLQKKSISNRSYSQNVMLSFGQFERENPDSIKVNTFTAISPSYLMHEDICTLALKKETSFIVLPFHRKWALDGSLESEDTIGRTLNCSVLERAPCSVGILIDRRHKKRPSESTYQICMIFIGGNDDREALTLAKRAAKSPNTHLTVMRLISEQDTGGLDWDKMLDSEVLKDVKQNDLEEEKTYIEEVVTDGSQTATIVHSLANHHDLFIIGRRHGIVSPQTSGLLEWGEFAELGALGDLLAARDVDITGLVLVVQQQQMTN